MLLRDMCLVECGPSFEWLLIEAGTTAKAFSNKGQKVAFRGNRAKYVLRASTRETESYHTEENYIIVYE